ncbi:hypothetical protein CGC49_09060 [Capnocytophaga sp. H4358]|uniref:hypothetical protein n=1 Tax=Capnocytophaga sp. H4358 TaxID=1945658 RepID=UPI000BB1D7D2|nr:hypothetical protein [Capnocytophaga sp. H4358]ATA73405.1 hypothetical protein CGC49_09060 [Capnocytophaga sp. H4358]
MKKIFLLFALFVLVANFANSQDMPAYMLKNPWVQGGKEGKNYAVIIHTDLSKKELITSTINRLKDFGIIDSKKEIKVDQVDENISQFSFPVIFLQTMAKDRMMGMGLVRSPLEIYAELHFEFHNTGGFLLAIKNLKNKRLTLLRMYDSSSDSKNEAYNEYRAEYDTTLMSKSLLTSILVTLNGRNVDEMNKRMTDYLADVESKFKTYETLVSQGDAAWFDGQELVSHFDAIDFPGKKYSFPMIKKAVEEERLIDVPEKRWEEHIRPFFDDIFKYLAFSLKGKIHAVAEDGEPTWEIVEGLLVPTDKKLQKKYLKNKQEY